MSLINNINEKLDQIVELAQSNTQIANYVQQQFDKMTAHILQNDEILQNNSILNNNNDLQRNQLQHQLHPDPPPAIKFDLSAANPIFSFPNQIVLTQAVIQGLVAQETSTEKDRVKQKLAGFDPRESPACIFINNHFGSDIHQQTLCEFAKKIAKKRQIILDRDSKRRKTVLLKWFHDHWDVIQADFENTQLLNDKLITKDQDELSKKNELDRDGLREF